MDTSKILAGDVLGVIGGEGKAPAVITSTQLRLIDKYGWSKTDCLMTHCAPIIKDGGKILDMTTHGPRFYHTNYYDKAEVDFRVFRYPEMPAEKRIEFGKVAIDISRIDYFLDSAKKKMKYDWYKIVGQFFKAHGIEYEMDCKDKLQCVELYFAIMQTLKQPIPAECMYPAYLGALAAKGYLVEIT